MLLPIATQAAAVVPLQSWNGYRWSRTAELAVRVGDNVSSVWDSYLDTGITQWNAAANITFVPAAGLTAPKACTAVYGTVQACSGNYGATGWLGYTTVWTAGGFIVQATIKLNDYYFSQAKYNTDGWRSITACQELGHALGLDHKDVTNTNANKGTCMDYTNDPTGTKGTNGTLSNMAPGASDFLALNGIYATVNSTQLAYTRPQFRAGDGYDLFGDVESPVVAVPEPATWAMLIVGFGLTGAVMRRRSTAKTRVLYA